jgi:hypothetical protein
MSTYEDRMTAAAMRRNPQYAQFMLRDKSQDPGVQESMLAQAMGSMEQRLARDEQMRQQQHLYKRGDVPVPMRKPEYQAPSPIEQWGQRISAMVKSGNPTLQAEGIKQMQKYQESSLPAEDKGTTDYQNFIASTAPSMRTHENFKKYLEEKRVQKTMAMQDLDSPMPASEAMNLVDKNGNPISPEIALTYRQAMERGLTRGKVLSDSAISESALYDQSSNILDQMTELRSKGANISGLGGWIEETRSGTGLQNIAIDKALSFLGHNPDPRDVQMVSLSANLQNTMTKAISGADVSAEQMERIKAQLPVPGQPDVVFQENLKLSRQNLQELNQMKKTARGKPTNPTTPPVSRSWKAGDGPSEGLFWVD